MKHPNTPKRLPYAIKDHATGGYVTGNSPHFPLIFSTAAEAHDNIPSHETLPANLSSSAISTYGLQNDQAGDLLRNPLGFAPSYSALAQAEQSHAGAAHAAPIPPHPSVIPPHSPAVNAAQAKQPAVPASPRVEVRVNPDAPARLPYGHWDNQAQDWVRGAHGFALAYGTRAEAVQKLPAEATPAALMGNAAGLQSHPLATPVSGSAALPAGSAGARPVFLDAHSGASFRTVQYQAPSQQNNQTRVSQPVKPAQQNPVAPAQNLYNLNQIESNTSIDPSSRQGIVVFVPGTHSNHSTFGKDFIGAVDKVYRPKVNYFFDWDASGTGKGTTSAAASDIQGIGPDKLTDEIKALKEKFPGVPVLVIAHSNGGDIAVAAENDNPGLTDLIIRFGSPTMGDLEQLEQNSRSSVIDIYDPRDKVQRGLSVLSGGENRLVPNQKNWHRISVTAPSSGLFAGIGSHLTLPSVDVWDQIQGDLLDYGKLKLFGGRADLADLR